jgi:hypothetical protein
MSRLEDSLREALKREDPGAEFTRRTLERAAAIPRRESAWRRWFHPPAWRWAAAGALACSLLVFSAVEYQRAQRARVAGEQAKEQLVLALRIAGTKLHMTQEKVVRQINR